MGDDAFTIRRWSYEAKPYREYEVLAIAIVPTTVEHIVPSAGERYAFDVQRYKRKVQIVVSPTRRSVRIFVDGEEVE